MPEDLKALIYAIHDTYGYHDNEEMKGREILRLLNSRGFFLVTNDDIRAYRDEGATDALTQGWDIHDI